MVRREIYNFEMKIEDASFPCRVPCSVGSVLAAAESEIAISSPVSFESKIYVDDVALAMKNFYLRLRGINRPAEVFIGDKKLCSTDGITPVYNLNVSGLLSKGDNILSVRFDPATAGDLRYAGIAATVEILRFSSAIIDRVNLTQKQDDGGVTLGISLDLIGDAGSVRAVATLVSSSGQIYYAGLTGGKGSIAVRDPLYWWPKGLGVQNLCRLTVNLYGESDIEDTAEMRIGLRSVKNMDGGSVLTVNNTELLPMGAVYVADGDPDVAASDRRMEGVVTSAAMAGYNCLVVPLSSPTPSEKFYELCDIHGIAVIEEHSSLDKAAVDSLRQRAHHACLCLIDLIGSPDPKADVARLREALPDLDVNIVDKAPEYIASPSLPSMKTIRAIIPEDERSLFSYSVEQIAEPGAIGEMLRSVAERYPYPSDLSEFSYASALASAHKIGEMVKQSRMSRGESGRAIFNRLSDHTLTISPSAIDYRARWKPLQYYASRHFAPISVYAETDGLTVRFLASSRRRSEFIGTLEYRVADASNYTVYKNSLPLELSAMASTEIHIADLAEYISGHEREYYLEYYLKEGAYPLSKKTMLFVPEKHFAFKKPIIRATVDGHDRRFSVTLSSGVFVKDLELGFDGVDAVFDDNYIDLTADAPVKINFTVIGAPVTANHLKDVLELRCVFDLK